MCSGLTVGCGLVHSWFSLPAKWRTCGPKSPGASINIRRVLTCVSVAMLRWVPSENFWMEGGYVGATVEIHVVEPCKACLWCQCDDERAASAQICKKGSPQPTSHCQPFTHSDEPIRRQFMVKFVSALTTTNEGQQTYSTNSRDKEKPRRT
jgi:hypothetical protein